MDKKEIKKIVKKLSKKDLKKVIKLHSEISEKIQTIDSILYTPDIISTSVY